MSKTWFEQLFGFAELPYDETQRRFTLDGEHLVSTVNGRRFSVGRFSTPSLHELREGAAGCAKGSLRVTHEVVGDALELHARPDNEGALFQVASQFNCLEFAGPDELPEDGVTQYDDDPTQGPACSLAAAAATVYRNYFVEIDGQLGQRRDRQLNNLADVLTALGEAGEYVDVRNGYTFSNADRLSRLNEVLASRDRHELMGRLRIGLHSRAQATFRDRFTEPDRVGLVSQAFCSALSCGYTGGGLALWGPLAALVLDGAYEATLLAAAIERERGRGSGKVWLTFLGGGAFGNDKRWIADAIVRALCAVEDRDLDVRIAHHRNVDEAMMRTIDAR